MFDYEYKKMTRAEAEGEMKIGRKHGYTSRILTKKDIEEIDSRRARCAKRDKLGCTYFAEDGFVCENCVCLLAFEGKNQRAKLEFFGKDAYLAVASYVELDGEPCVIEAVKKFDGNLLVDFGGG